jgi:putative Holliday junction resolvase
VKQETPQNPGRILGIDYGTTRLGISMSDPLLILAQPYQTIDNDRKTIGTIAELVDQEGISLIVVGLPLNLKGEKGKKAEEVERFVSRLSGSVGVDVITWDERFTTHLAHQTLRDMGTRRSQRERARGRIDAMAASLLLQSYLDSRRRSSCS